MGIVSLTGVQLLNEVVLVETGVRYAPHSALFFELPFRPRVVEMSTLDTIAGVERHLHMPPETRTRKVIARWIRVLFTWLLALGGGVIKEKHSFGGRDPRL